MLKRITHKVRDAEEDYFVQQVSWCPEWPLSRMKDWCCYRANQSKNSRYFPSLVPSPSCFLFRGFFHHIFFTLSKNNPHLFFFEFLETFCEALLDLHLSHFHCSKRSLFFLYSPLCCSSFRNLPYICHIATFSTLSAMADLSFFGCLTSILKTLPCL